MTALGRDLRDSMARVVPLHRPVEEPELPRSEDEIGHQAIWELSIAESVMDEVDEVDGGGEPGQPLGDRLRAHFASQ